jgi:phosphoglycolate phosphatase-like HAD superfamily hydrolase
VTLKRQIFIPVFQINNYENYIFDCDGVILKSNSIKTNAFKHALNEFNKNKVDMLINYHKKNGGISRQKKIEYFFNNIEKKTINPNLDKYINRFGKYSRSQLMKSVLIGGVLNFIKHIHKNDKRLFIVSGSLETELKYILKYKNISKYFTGIFGSPKDKYEILKNLSVIIESKKSVFFGDSEIDYFVSKSNNIDFVYVSEDSEWNPQNLEQFNLSIKNFNSLKYE